MLARRGMPMNADLERLIALQQQDLEASDCARN